MSADNGIYIAEFEDGFRVSYTMAIDNLNFFPENSESYLDVIKDIFGDSKTFPTKEEAYSFASKMAEGIDYLEYGICFIGNLPLWRK